MVFVLKVLAALIVLASAVLLILFWLNHWPDTAAAKLVLRHKTIAAALIAAAMTVFAGFLAWEGCTATAPGSASGNVRR